MSVSTSFEVSSHRSGEDHSVSPAGDIDLSSHSILRAALLDAVPSGAGEIVLDLSEVEFMDSSGIRVLCEAMEHLSSEGLRLRIVTPPGQVRRLIELCGLARLLGDDLDATA